jgi:urocanate hydratase
LLLFDVANGLARRGWARNEGAILASEAAMKLEPNLQITKPHLANDELIDNIIK